METDMLHPRLFQKSHSVFVRRKKEDTPAHLLHLPCNRDAAHDMPRRHRSVGIRTDSHKLPALRPDGSAVP